MPKLGLTMTEGTVAEWRVAEGGRFARGEAYLVVETDKVANEIEAPDSGRLMRILVPQGETVPVGAVLAEWEAEEEAQVQAPAAAVAPPAEAPAGAGRRHLPASGTQLAAARRLAEAKQKIPHFYLTTEIEVSALQALRAQWNAQPGRPKLTLTHLLVAALACALAERPELNRVWEDDGFAALASVDVGIVVHTERGLVVPVLRDADRKSLAQTTQEIAALVERARAGSLSADDVGGCAISISNAGMHEVTYMASIIHPGQAAMLGVGSERALFRPDQNGAPRLTREIGVVLSCDHRVLDGVKGLALLNALRAQLEAPGKLFT